ncbi:MAG: tetratricopeptide repeat protein [Rhodothermales bacterium]|jgi:tetratricopeptide (TPR) repeat protein
MARIFKLAGRPAERFGYKRAARGRRGRKEPPGQMNLFGLQTRILALPSQLSRFEEALLLHERDDPAAGEKYREAIRDGDCIADAWCNLGILESQAERDDEALSCFSKSLQADPGLFEAHYNLGNLHFELDNLAAARLHYEVARSINGTYAQLYYNLGLVLASENDLSGAIEALVKYRELAPAAEATKVDDLLQSLRQSLAVGK